MPTVMYDSVTLSEVPANPPAVAAYVNGLYANVGEARSRFPHARILTIAISADADADCLDVEPGDAVNSQAPAWVRRQHARGLGDPVVYTSASNAAALISTLANAGIPRTAWRLWSAHYNFLEHICSPATCGYPSANATQWTDKALGRNLDQSFVSDYFWGPPPPPPPPPDPHHYKRFAEGPFDSRWGKLNERSIVLHYDGARQHPIRYRRYIKFLREQLRFLADRVWTVSHEQKNKDGKPSWDRFYRGWRYQELAKRADGQKIA